MKSAVVLTLLWLVCSTTSQSYHFSNGWNPGKRSSPTCTFNPYVKSMIFKLIENETHRLEKCSRSVMQDPMNFFPMEKEEGMPVSQVVN